MKHYQFICFSYDDCVGSFHFHYRTRKEMKAAMKVNFQPWDTFSYGKVIPHFARLRTKREKELGCLNDSSR